MSDRVQGAVKFFNKTKRWGFIKPDDGTGDVFVHGNNLPPGLMELYDGQRVSFDVERTKKGARAINVDVLA